MGDSHNTDRIEVGYGLGHEDDAFCTGVEATRQATQGLREHSLSVVLVFASVRYDLEELLRGVHSVAGEVPVIGSTTAGEICNRQFQESVVVAALASPCLRIRVGVGQDVSKEWRQAVSQALEQPEIRPFFSAEDSSIWPELTRQGKAAFALLFSPGNTRQADSRSYEILEELKRLSHGMLPIFGGSSADDWRMERNYVLLGQRAYPDSVLVAVFETQLRFGIGLAHGLRPTPRRATVTRSRGHEVLELDGRPAAEAYTQLLGSTREALQGKHLTLATGQPAGSPDPYGQYSINVASFLTPGGGVRFAQPVREGTVLAIMEVDKERMIAAGREALRKAMLRGGITDPAAVLVCPCALRTRLLEERAGEEIRALRQMIPSTPVVGFYSFGEQGLADDGSNRHNNEVITTLVLGRELSYAAQVAMENERLQKKLRESEERYRLLVETANAAIFSVDYDGVYLYMNGVAAQELGGVPDDFVGRSIWDVFPRHVAERHIAGVRRMIRSGKGRIRESETVLQGEPRWYRTNSQPLKDGTGNIYAVMIIGTDVTEHKRAEEEIRRQTAQLEALRETGFALTAQLDLDALLHAIALRAVELVGGSEGGLYLYRPDRDVLEWAMAIGPNMAPLGTVLHRGEGLCGSIWATGEPLIVDDYSRWEGRADVYEGYPFTATMGVPIRWGEEFLGVLNVNAGDPHTFSSDDADLLGLFATQAAIAIRNARLYEESQRQSRRLGQTLATSELLHQDLKLEQVLTHIAQGATELGFRRAVVNIRDADGELVRVKAVAGLEGREREVLEGAVYRWSDFQVLMQEQFQVSRSYLIHHRALDWETEFQGVIVRSGVPDGRPGYWHPDDMLLIPLWSTPGEPVGLLAVDEPRDDRIPDLNTIQTLETFANQAALAVQNARLLAAEREQRQLAEALEQAAAAVNSALDLEEVLDRILEQVERVVAGDAFNVMLVEGQDARVVRSRCYEEMGMAGQIVGLSTPIAAYPSLAQMVNTGKPVVVEDTRVGVDWTPRPGWEWLLSYVGAPIQVNRVTVGFLNVDGTVPGQFGHADAHRLKAFADHAATAIENAQLYQEVRRYADQLEERVQERTTQLRDQYARLDAILHNTADGIVVTDARGEIIQANPVAQTWLTRTLCPEEAGQLRGAVRDVAGQTVEQPVALLELKGLDLELSAAPISEPAEAKAGLGESAPSDRSGKQGEGEPAAVVAIHDVSHLRALDRMKTRFVTNISHELRTPVTTIKLYAELMQRLSPGDQDWRRYLDTLAAEANHQARLVENILQISRIDAGRLEMQPRPTPLTKLTQAAIASHRPSARERGLTLERSPAEPDLVALVDPDQMEQVLDKLISNAIRYTPEGGQVTVSTETREAEGRTWATVMVSDTGIGIPEEELPHVFDRFFRGLEPRARQISGTGLGLAIVREIAELHGGRVTVQSAAEEGSAFTVWLPLAAPERSCQA